MKAKVSMYQKLFGNRTLSLFSALGLGLALGLAGCAKKKADDAPDSAGADENRMGDSDSGTAQGLQSIPFPYDSFTLSGDAKKKIAANAGILKSNGSLKVQVEGHCDERGGIQYNLALGEKRAEAVRKYLVDQGVEASRIQTISFGKERPLDPSGTEEAYAKNRRANFVITSN